MTWLDWDTAATAISRTMSQPSPRSDAPILPSPIRSFLSGEPGPDGIPDVAWLTPAGRAKSVADWEAAASPAIAMVLGRGGDGRLAVLFNRSGHEITFHLPARDGHRWGCRRRRIGSARGQSTSSPSRR